MLRGTLLAESLRTGVDLAVPDLRLVRIGRHDVSGSAVPTQPDVWTFVEFEAVMGPGEDNATSHERVKTLTEALGLDPADRISSSYGDLLEAR